MSAIASALSYGAPRRLPKPPRLLFPINVVREYRRSILAMLDPARDLVLEQLVPLLPSLIREATGRDDGTRNDDYADTIDRVFGDMRVEYQRTISDDQFDTTARNTASRTNTHNAGQVGRQVRTVLGIDTIGGDPRIEADAKAFVRQNVALIKSVPARYFDEIEQIVLQHVRTGRRADEIAALLEQRFDVARSRADFIAQDQVGKFNGLLTERRHTGLGLVRYRWRNSRDERVRGNPAGKYPHAKHNHHTREGQIYEYAKAPADGNPGQPYRCRCFAEPVFEDILPKRFGVDLTPAPVANRASLLVPSERTRGRSGGLPVLKDGMTLVEAENAIRKRGVEHIGAFDAAGKLLHTDVGTRNSVPVPHKLMLQMRQRGDVLLTHNHPNGSPFSPEDISIAITGNAREIRATVPSGGAWILRRPRTGWSVGGTFIGLRDTMRMVFNVGRDKAQRRYDEALRDGRRARMGKTRRDALWRRLWHEEAVRAYNDWGKDYGWRVERED